MAAATTATTVTGVLRVVHQSSDLQVNSGS